MIEELDSAIIEALKQKGYTLVRSLSSEGHTRDVYEVLYESGALRKTRVIKIPKEIDFSSITSLVNLQKRDINENEVVCSNEFRHPNIAEIVDTVRLPDGETAVVEEFFNATSLEEILHFSSGLSDERFKDIFTKVIEGLHYANMTAGVLHRDLKPSNILVEKQGGQVKITDWQNARKRKDIQEQCLPTRGETAYTHPGLLNALLNGGEACATLKTEVYALGVSMYYALTGKKPFDYKVEEDPEGIPVNINGQTKKLSIFTNGSKYRRLTKRLHESKLDNTLKEVPRKYKALLRNMLSFDSGYDSIIHVKNDFEEICRSNKEKIFEKAARYLKIGALTALACTAISAGIYIGIKADVGRGQDAPTLADVLRGQDRLRSLGEGNLERAGMLYNGHITDQFTKLIEEAEKRKDILENKELAEILGYADRPTEVIDKRLCYSLLRSIELSSKCDIKDRQGRTDRFFVPEDYIKMHFREVKPTEEDFTGFREAMWAMRYIQHCYKFGDSLEEAYTKALCSNDELAKAIVDTQHSYLMKNLRYQHFNGVARMGDVASAENIAVFKYFARAENGKTIPGYSSELDPVKRNIIDRAVALYLITDSEGKINFDNYKSRPISGLAAK